MKPINLAVLLTLLGIATASAGTITVVNLPATNTDAATGITTNKFYLDALDFGTYGSPPTNINGVLFNHIDPGNQTVNFYTNSDTNFGGRYILSSGGSAACKLARTAGSGTSAPTQQADGNTRLLLYDIIYVGSAAPVNSWIAQEYDSLTVGHQYSLRIYFRQWVYNTTSPRTQNVSFNGEGTNQLYAGNPLNEDAGGAHFIEYDFTAANTNVFAYFTNLIGNESPMIYGATLEDDSVPFAPFITHQPTAAGSGSTFVFTATAIGTAPLTYQWYVNTSSNYSGAVALTDGNGVSGSMTTNLTIATNLLEYYFVVASNGYGAATSSIAQINPLPVIVTQPSPTLVGNSVVFNVAAAGFPPLGYQWYFNTASNYTGATALVDGNGISGSMTTNLTTTTNLQDFYFVVVTNNYGSVTSAISAYNPLPMIVAQPAVFKNGSSVGFTVAASGIAPLSYQWFYNTTSNYTGASALANGSGVSGVTTTNVTVANLLDYYYVVVSNYYGAVTSQIVEVAIPLTVVAAGEPIWNPVNQTNVVVTFSDALDQTTATTIANYSLNNGATILSAVLGGANEVVLTTTTLSSANSYTLTVQNVNDYYGITLSPTPTTASVGLYPANLALWVKANTGVTTDSYGVNQWNDLSGNGNNLYNPYGYTFEPQLATNAQGDTVIRFTAANETLLSANSSPTLAITNNMSIVAVVNFAILDGGTNGMIVSKTTSAIAAPYDYYVSATNSGAHLYRGNGTTYGQFQALSAPSLGTPHILAVSMAGTNVSHYLDGLASGTGSLNNGFSVTNIRDTAQPLYLGTRADTVNRLTGDISELIMAASPLSTYDISALDTYLAQTHNIILNTVNPTPTNISYSYTGGLLTLSWPLDHIGWGLQSNSINLAFTNDWFTIPNTTTTNQFSVYPAATMTNVFYRMILP